MVWSTPSKLLNNQVEQPLWPCFGQQLVWHHTWPWAAPSQWTAVVCRLTAVVGWHLTGNWPFKWSWGKRQIGYRSVVAKLCRIHGSFLECRSDNTACLCEARHWDEASEALTRLVNIGMKQGCGLDLDVWVSRWSRNVLMSCLCLVSTTIVNVSVSTIDVSCQDQFSAKFCRSQ